MYHLDLGLGLARGVTSLDPCVVCSTFSGQLKAEEVLKIEAIVHSVAKAYCRNGGQVASGKLTVPPPMQFRYGVVALGGTFDVFHVGHEQLISKAFELGRKVIIGLTSDAFVRKQGKNHAVQAFPLRLRTLRVFLGDRGWLSRAILVSLRDPYGPTARRRNVEALVITPDTASSALKLNQLRASKGLPRLRIHTVPLFMAEDGKPISSTRIRRGEIDRQGRLKKS